MSQVSSQISLVAHLDNSTEHSCHDEAAVAKGTYEHHGNFLADPYHLSKMIGDVLGDLVSMDLQPENSSTLYVTLQPRSNIRMAAWLPMLYREK